MPGSLREPAEAALGAAGPAGTATWCLRLAEAARPPGARTDGTICVLA